MEIADIRSRIEELDTEMSQCRADCDCACCHRENDACACKDASEYKMLMELLKYKEEEEKGMLVHLPFPVGTPYWTIERKEDNDCDFCEYYHLDYCQCCASWFEKAPTHCLCVKEYTYDSVYGIMNRDKRLQFDSKEDAEKAVEKLKVNPYGVVAQ